jgi:exodeoxyribonuclease V alpha subunit
VQAALAQAERSGRVLFDNAGNAVGIGPMLLERQVADCIVKLLKLKENAMIDVDSIIYEAEQQQGFALNIEQRQSVTLVADNRFAVITGGAGCGKTTTLKVICKVLDAQGYEIVQLALAGKAVRRMMEATGLPAQTIASFIKAQKEEPESRFDAKKKLALLVDEASMVDLISFAAIARAINDECKIILTGDPHQLPPVGPGLILHALTSGIVPHVELKVGQRFGSDIADVATAVRDGLLPDLAGNTSVQLIEPRSPEDITDLATSLYMTDPQDSIVLCGSKAVAEDINRAIQARTTIHNTPVTVWNHQYDSRQDLGLRLHDPVICGRNHWDRGLQNGSIGRITAIDMLDEDDVTGTIAWDDGVERAFDLELLADLSLGYALTVHKSQGSQWRRVIVVLSAGRLLDRSLVYTAITRAQKEVTLIGQRVSIDRAITAPKAADRRHVALEKWMMHVLRDASENALSTTRKIAVENYSQL